MLSCPVPSADIVRQHRRASLQALPHVLGEIRSLASGRPARHPSPLSALCWREVGAGPVMAWSQGRLGMAPQTVDPPAADEAPLALPRLAEEVSPMVGRFMEGIEDLVPDRRRVLALLGGADLVVPVDPACLRIPFGAEAAEIAAAAVAARALFLCGPWLPEDGGAGRRRLGTSLFLAGIVAEAAGVVDEALDAAGHVAAVVLEEPVLRGWGRARPVEFAGRS